MRSVGGKGDSPRGSPDRNRGDYQGSRVDHRDGAAVVEYISVRSVGGEGDSPRVSPDCDRGDRKRRHPRSIEFAVDGPVVGRNIDINTTVNT